MRIRWLNRCTDLIVTITIAMSGFYLALMNNAYAHQEPKQPNVLLIVADDLGFNDLGFFGSEISTPNLDSLAKQGVVLTHFYTAPTCSPTRAMLLSGTDNHIAGMGVMEEGFPPEFEGKPGYEGYLNFSVAALPELFKDAGYRTYMTGKWHLGQEESNGPTARGFEKSYALMDAGAGAFNNKLRLFGDGEANYREGKTKIEKLPKDFYSTKFYTETMINYIDNERDTGKPFFAYLAYTAPHWPLQAPRASIEKYRGKYDQGYDVLTEQRIKNLQALGFISKDVPVYPQLLGEKPWRELDPEEQRRQARTMEIYAAMVDDLDQYIGKVVTYLKESKQYDNTVIVFMSDNGPEGNDISAYFPWMPEWLEKCCNNEFDNLGNADSYTWLGPNWARASSAPLRMFKGYTSEGGLRTPAFFHYPKKFNAQTNNKSFVSVKDVMPTLLELADIKHPGAGNYKGRKVVAMQGDSLVPMLINGNKSIDRKLNYTGWELYDYRALRSGDWKIYYSPIAAAEPLVKVKKWQLFNLADDPTEMMDLADKHPKKLAEMLELWDTYVKENGVIEPID